MYLFDECLSVGCGKTEAGRSKSVQVGFYGSAKTKRRVRTFALIRREKYLGVESLYLPARGLYSVPMPSIHEYVLHLQ